jgi:transposase
MALPTIFQIKESEAQIKKMIRTAQPMISKRLQALLHFKKHEHEGISKRDVAFKIGVNHNSIQTWRKLYIDGGISSLIAHSKKSNIVSVITKEQEILIKEQLNNPNNGFVGFTEFLQWFNEHQNTNIKYKTFYSFLVRKFNAKVKVARKSHINKDAQAVEYFKKTSVKSAKKQ